MTAQPFPAPNLDHDSSPWWEATAEGLILLQTCTDCGAVRWPPRAMCNRCGAFDWSWRPSNGTATVASWIVNRHAFGPDTPCPYVVLVARLDEQDDVLIPGAWAGDQQGSDLQIDLPIEVTFDPVERTADGVRFARLRWARRGDSAATDARSRTGARS